MHSIYSSMDFFYLVFDNSYLWMCSFIHIFACFFPFLYIFVFFNVLIFVSITIICSIIIEAQIRLLSGHCPKYDMSYLWTVSIWSFISLSPSSTSCFALSFSLSLSLSPWQPSSSSRPKLGLYWVTVTNLCTVSMCVNPWQSQKPKIDFLALAQLARLNNSPKKITYPHLQINFKQFQGGWWWWWIAS